MVEYKDRVRESTSTTGTGDITLAGAPTGFQSFNTAYGTSVQFDYAIVSATGADWEIGEGHLSASTTLVRDTVHDSSNAGAAVNFSAGAKDVRGIVSGVSLEAGIGNQTTFIRTLLDDASASDARATLGLAYATAAEQEAGTETNKVVAPATQHRHPSAIKCSGRVTVSGGTPTLAEGYNVTSITDAGVGLLTVTIATDFSNSNYRAVCTPQLVTGGDHFSIGTGSHAVGAITFTCKGADDGVAPNDADPGGYDFMMGGDQ